MDYCREAIKSVVETQKKILQFYTKEFENAIKGGLTCNYNHGRNRFYHMYKGKGEESKGKYIRKHLNPEGGEEILKQLARKEYLRVEIPRLQRDIELLERALEKYQSTGASEIIPGMKRAYRMLDESWYFNNDLERTRAQLLKELQGGIGSLNWGNRSLLSKSAILLHRPWAEAPYERNPYPFGDDEIYASDGTRLRSKAEGMAYECLLKYKAPFRIEPMIYGVDSDGIPYELAPDFAFEDAGLDEFYWEICGMMDNPKYVQRHQEKLKIYAKAGIVPWKNIIFTYLEGNDIDMGHIESIVKYQILPRL